MSPASLKIFILPVSLLLQPGPRPLFPRDHWCVGRSSLWSVSSKAEMPNAGVLQQQHGTWCPPVWARVRRFPDGLGSWAVLRGQGVPRGGTCSVAPPVAPGDAD